MKKSVLIILITGLFALCAQATPTLTVSPASGHVGGEPGATVGWGFTVDNTGPDYLLLLSSDLNFTSLPVLGTYTDYLGGQFVVVGPAPEVTSVSESFDSTAQTGVGQFQLDPLANNFGTANLVVHYALFSQDPNDPSFDPSTVIVPDATLSAAVSISAPEPGSAAMMLAGVPLLLGTFKRKLFR